MSNNFIKRTLPTVLAGLFFVMSPVFNTNADQPKSYQRVRRPNNHTVCLDIASRKFVPKIGHGPVIWLVGAVHIADANYYNSVQQFLNTQTLVLYEGIGRPDFIERTDATDIVLADRTRSGLRFVALSLGWYKQRFGTWPGNLAILRQAIGEHHRHIARWLSKAMTDGWDNPISYKRSARGFTLTSFGSDGQPNGNDHAADIIYNTPPSAKTIQQMTEPQLQATLAHSLGLAFQLEMIDYDKKHFRNSDMTITQIQRHVSGGDKQLSKVMAILDGNSLAASMIKLGLKIIRSSKKIQTMVKLMMIEMIGSIEGDMSKMKGLPPDMADLMKVLIRDRNKIVLNDLRREFAMEKPAKSIAVFYGAAHMPDLEKRVVEELGYKPIKDLWLTAFSADARDAGMSDAELKMMQSMIQQQMNLMQAEREN